MLSATTVNDGITVSAEVRILTLFTQTTVTNVEILAIDSDWVCRLPVWIWERILTFATIVCNKPSRQTGQYDT